MDMVVRNGRLKEVINRQEDRCGLNWTGEIARGRRTSATRPGLKASWSRSGEGFPRNIRWKWTIILEQRAGGIYRKMERLD